MNLFVTSDYAYIEKHLFYKFARQITRTMVKVSFGDHIRLDCMNHGHMYVQATWHQVNDAHTPSYLTTETTY